MSIDEYAEYEKLKRKSRTDNMSMRVKDVLRFFDLKEKFNDRQHNKRAVEKSGDDITRRK
jgi:hypothetical protein